MSEEITRKTLDEFDLMLIQELEIDARKSSLELAAKLGTSHTTVRRRLQNLLDDGIISFVTITDHKTLGYLTLILLGINTRPGKVGAVAGKIASLKYSKMVTASAGHYDLLASMVIENFEDLAGFVFRDLGAIKDITNIDSMIILEVFKNDWSCLVEKGHVIDRNPSKKHLDEFEISLIRELELQPRETISELAKKLGANRANVSKCMQSLLERGVIRMVSVPNLSALGYKLSVLLRLKVDPSRVEEIAEELCRYPTVMQVIRLTGAFELGIVVIFRNQGEVHDFIEKKLGKIRGMMGHEALMILKNYKRAFGLLPLREQ